MKHVVNVKYSRAISDIFMMIGFADKWSEGADSWREGVNVVNYLEGMYCVFVSEEVAQREPAKESILG
jgi:hypothetical protein